MLWPQAIKTSGFSLIELLVVFTLLALIATFSGAHFLFLQRILVRSELEQLYITCAMLQRSAKMFNQNQIIFFDITNNSYRYKNSIHTLPHHVSFGVTSGVKGPPSSPERIISNPVSFQAQKVTFMPEGIIQPGTIYLTDSSKRYTFALSCGVGHVSYLRKYEYTNGIWKEL